ncbi:MAG: hypothetical protein IJR99_03670 [Kiritimatiellae bacterium]|nr:hypothetical protein [Kiritimatiellia bacterium]
MKKVMFILLASALIADCVMHVFLIRFKADEYRASRRMSGAAALVLKRQAVSGCGGLDGESRLFRDASSLRDFLTREWN